MLNAAQETAVIELVREVAHQEIMPRYRRVDGIATRTKSRFDDLVTEADLAAETRLTQGFRALFPGCLVVGEEAASEHPDILANLDAAELAVVIDPIDGTWNFAHGVNSHGVIIAVVSRGETLFGLLYDSVMDDWLLARRGAGSWYQRPGTEPVRINIGAGQDDAELSGFVAPATFAAEQRATVNQLIARYGRIETLRCCCHEYRTLAQGNIDFFVYPKNNVWDNAAGVLAVQEAGGAVAMLDGSAYRPSATTGTIVAAKNRALLERILADFSVLR